MPGGGLGRLLEGKAGDQRKAAQGVEGELGLTGTFCDSLDGVVASAPCLPPKLLQVPLWAISNPEPSREGDSGKWLQRNQVVHMTIPTTYF